MRTHLPFTPRAQAGESPLSLLRRAAHGNGVRSMLGFAVSLNPNIDFADTAFGTLARNPGLFGRTCLAAGIPEADIEATIYRRVGAGGRDELIWNGLRVPVGGVSFRRAKTCVACLLEQGYSSSEWDHRAAVACARHEVLLQDGCPVCRAEWTHDRGALACGCSPEEVRALAIPVPSATAILLNRLIAARDQVGLSLLGCVEQVLTWWQRLGLRLQPLSKAMALEKLFTGQWPESPESVASPNVTRVHPRVAVAPLLVSSLPAARSLAVKLLEKDVPALMGTHLESKLSANEAMSVLGVRRVPFAKLVRDGHLASKANALAASDLNLLLWSTHGCRSPDQNLVSIQKLRTGKHRLSMSAIVGDIHAGRITAYHCPVSRGLEGLQVQDQSRAKTSSHLPEIGLREVAFRLGVHGECVRSLIRTGQLRATRDLTAAGAKWTFEPAAVERFDSSYVFASVLAKAHGAPVTTLASRLRSKGVAPASGPDIDGGLTYFFRRADIAGLDLDRVAADDYVSPAGRRPISTPRRKRVLSWTEAARTLALSSHQLRVAVADGWFDRAAGGDNGRGFVDDDVYAIRDRVARAHLPLQTAATALNQTPAQFRRTWVDSGLVPVRRFGDQDLIGLVDLERLQTLWQQLATGSEIGRLTGRHRTLCSNLEKIGQLQPVQVIGAGTRKVKLYSRTAEAFARFLPANPGIAGTA